MATGTGIVADEITSGTLSAIAITGVNISGTEITGGSVKGANISGGTLNIGNNNYMVNTQGNLTCNGSVVLAGNILMNGHVSWGVDNSPVKVQYSVDGRTNWHTTFNNDDKFARYSYDGGNSYTPAVKIVGTDGTSVKIIGEVSDPSLLPPTANIGDAYICQGDLWVFVGGINKWQNVGRIKGDDGVPGQNGSDGKTYYTWVKYALTSNGDGMTNAIGEFKVNELTVTVTNTATKVSDMQNRKYLGLANNKDTATESNNPSDYQWSLIVGEDGKNGEDGKDGSAGDKGDKGDNGQDGVTYYTWIVYADTSSGSGITTNPVGKAYMGIRYNMLVPTPSLRPSDYTFFKIKGENGSDANVPAYIKDTYIDSTIIKSPTIQGNVINAGTVTGGYIKGTTIEGTNINGSNIKGGSVKVDNFYLGDPATKRDQWIEFMGYRLNFYDDRFKHPDGSHAALMVMENQRGWNNSHMCGLIVGNGKSSNQFVNNGTMYGSGYIMPTEQQSSRKFFNIGGLGGFGYYAIDLKAENSLWDFSGGLGLEVAGNLMVTGKKNSKVPTEHYGQRLLYAEESDRVYFNTKGLAETHATTDGKYQFIIRLDEVFLETIEHNSICPYIINLTPYSDSRLWVSSVLDKYIIIESNQPTRFAYNVQCTRKDYKDIYLEETQTQRELRKEVQ
ncbi:MAG: hypothetical protein ACRCX8_01375 [Sarcina sp.]